MAENTSYNRLSVSFHQTFIPERLYITALLRFVAKGGSGTDQDISTQTGIPVGKSSGKVPAIISYCVGMNLIQVFKKSKIAPRGFSLTPFGRSVLLEDANLSEKLTQWLVHLHLCRRSGGAEIWYLCFAKGCAVMGMKFSEAQLAAYLEGVCGNTSRSIIGPLLRTYEEPASLKIANIVSRKGEAISRTAAPLQASYRRGYSAFLLSLWDTHFPGEQQVTLADFERETLWQKMCGWDSRQMEIALDIVQETGAIRVDKQMRPWVLCRCAETNKFWTSIYDELA